MIPFLRNAAVWAVLALGIPSFAVADDYSFITLRLPHRIQIDAPRHWWVLDEQMNRLIATSRDAALDLSGTDIRYSGNVLFAANSMSLSTYASIR